MVSSETWRYHWPLVWFKTTRLKQNVWEVFWRWSASPGGIICFSVSVIWNVQPYSYRLTDKLQAGMGCCRPVLSCVWVILVCGHHHCKQSVPAWILNGGWAFYHTMHFILASEDLALVTASSCKTPSPNWSHPLITNLFNVWKLSEA